MGQHDGLEQLMGKHNTNSHEAAKRSRAGRQSVSPGSKRRGSLVAAKAPRKAALKLEKRQAAWDAMSKDTQLKTTRPGSMKMKRN